MSITIAAIIVLFTFGSWLLILSGSNLSNPNWIPTVREQPVLATSLILSTANATLLLVFLLCMAAEWVELDKSLRFAALGIPFGILAICGGIKASTTNMRALGIVVSSLVDLIFWVFLCMLH